MNVVPFKNSIPPGEVNLEIVEDLEALLAKAKSGDLRAFAYATLDVAETTATGWAGSDGSRHGLAHGIMILHSRFAQGLWE